MKVAFHVNTLERGTGVVALDYAKGLQSVLGLDAFAISGKGNIGNGTMPIEKFEKANVRCILYDDMQNDLPKIIDKEKIDVIVMARWGTRDWIPNNCKVGIHCVFVMTEPYGDVYAGVSEYIAKKYSQPLWVPHIVDMPRIDTDLRDELSIPKDAFVFGRLGGKDQFNLPFVHAAILAALDRRPDLYFVFMNTTPFIDHSRVKFLPFNADVDGTYKRKFINTADAMIHARADGETFGLAVAEFSAMGKAIFTWDGWWDNQMVHQYDRAHLDILGTKAILYSGLEDLYEKMIKINKAKVNAFECDMYTERFSPKNVMQKFKEVFL
jgi:glycosyltransferase involved in cell wall biosynthesis